MKKPKKKLAHLGYQYHFRIPWDLLELIDEMAKELGGVPRSFFIVKALRAYFTEKKK